MPLNKKENTAVGRIETVRIKAFKGDRSKNLRSIADWIDGVAHPDQTQCGELHLSASDTRKLLGYAEQLRIIAQENTFYRKGFEEAYRALHTAIKGHPLSDRISDTGIPHALPRAEAAAKAAEEGQPTPEAVRRQEMYRDAVIGLNQLILETPTGEMRNKLTDIHILLGLAAGVENEIKAKPSEAILLRGGSDAQPDSDPKAAMLDDLRVRLNQDTGNPIIQTEVEVKISRIRDLLVGALEGGSNSWYENVRCVRMIGGFETLSGKALDPFRVGGALRPKDVDDLYGPLHILPFLPGYAIQILASDGVLGARYHSFDINTAARGLSLMATKHKTHFADFFNEQDDATTSDVFLQLALFGEIVYT